MLTIRETVIQSESYSPRTQPVDMLVLHYTELNLEESLRVLRTGSVSAHFVLDVDGTVYKILDAGKAAWHAGLSMWRGQAAVNARSIGIEIVNMNGNRHPYPAVQMESLIVLCRRILEENPAITPGNIVGHSDIAPKRKVDPGRFFPWRALAEAGIGLWPFNAQPEAVGTQEEICALLAACGYPKAHAYGVEDGRFVYVPDPEHPPSGVSDVVTVTMDDIVRAFQLRYEPDRATGAVTPLTMGILRRVALMAERGGCC